MSDERTVGDLVADIEHGLLLLDPEVHKDSLPGGVCEDCGADAIEALDELARRASERDRAVHALEYECPRYWHVGGVDVRPDACETVKMDAQHCNIAHGIGWDECPEYPEEVLHHE